MGLRYRFRREEGLRSAPFTKEAHQVHQTRREGLEVVVALLVHPREAPTGTRRAFGLQSCNILGARAPKCRASGWEDMCRANGPHQMSRTARDPELEIIASLKVELRFRAQLVCARWEWQMSQEYWMALVRMRGQGRLGLYAPASPNTLRNC